MFRTYAIAGSREVHPMSKVLFASLLSLLSLFALMFALGAKAQSFQTSLTENEFTLPPGGSYTFTLPVSYIPVHITVSDSPENGGTQTPSELMYAVVNYDAKSGQLTWIGTSSDGVTSAGTTLTGTVIANIGGGNAILHVASASAHTLNITQSATRTSISEHYVVTVSY